MMNMALIFFRINEKKNAINLPELGFESVLFSFNWKVPLFEISY
jgi:hypothetical protein